MDEHRDAVDEDLDELDAAGRYLSRRFPRAWRVGSIAVGVLLVLNCFYFVVPVAIIFADEFDGITIEAILVLLFLLAWGVGSLVLGIRMVHRAWASKPTVASPSIRAPSPRGGWSAERER
jgi:hypothetical protein